MLASQQDRLKFDIFMQRVEKATRIRSQNQLAGVLGIHRSAVTRAKRNGTVPRKWIFQMAEVFDIDPHWLETGLRGKKAPEVAGGGIVWVPRVEARLSAGAGSFETTGRARAVWPFKRSWIQGLGKADALVLIEITGDSMEPNIRSGDTVMIDQSQKDIVAGGIYAVGIDDVIMIKRLEKRPGQLALISDNGAYDTVLIDGAAENVRVLGRVVWLGRRIS